MGPTLGAILPLAVGVAISPVPIIAVILMLFSARARINGPAFLVGWIAALCVVGAIGIVLAGAAGTSGGSTSSTVAAAIQVVLGLGLLLLAVRSWRGRPKTGEAATMPPWMASIDAFTPGRALGLAALLAGVNPKNLLLSLSAGSTIGAASLGTGEAVAALLFFVVVGSVSVAVPVAYHRVGGERARKTLDGWKGWLTANNATVMTVVLIIIGAKVLGQGIGALIG